MARLSTPNRGVAFWVDLIPINVDGDGVQVGGGVNQKEDETLEIPRSDMV